MKENQPNEELMEVSKLVKDAQKKGVDFGKGDPYNRLRYYTKIGLLPHMERKKIKGGEIRGHYPKWVLQRLIKIESLKAEGRTNEEILKEIETDSKKNVLKEVLRIAELRKKAIFYSALAILAVVLAVELNILTIGKSKTELIEQTKIETSLIIVDQGEGFFPQDRKQVYVKSDNVYSNSNIQVTFKGDYSPATRYWVSKIDPLKGFYLELDAPSYSDVIFNWWIIE